MAELMQRDGFTKLADKRFQVLDETYAEAYAKLPLAKRIDLWKNCDGRAGGLSFEEYDGKYIEPTAAEKASAKAEEDD